ncbi:MAG: hypothetical protein JSU67_04225 [Gammaproteobacteria bacterium]|nr:MAG: hypothetical protein JSU67_04225 [Gammaproteobacteria bacterium]
MSLSKLLIGCCLMLQGFISTCQAQNTILQEANEQPPPEAPTLETDIIQRIDGYKGDVLGAEVVSITPAENDAFEVIEISIPIDPEIVDQVTVVGPSGQLLELGQPIEISPDQEKDIVGITLTLSKKKKLGFQIKLIDLPDE